MSVVGHPVHPSHARHARHPGGRHAAHPPGHEGVGRSDTPGHQAPGRCGPEHGAVVLDAGHVGVGRDTWGVFGREVGHVRGQAGDRQGGLCWQEGVRDDGLASLGLAVSDTAVGEAAH